MSTLGVNTYLKEGAGWVTLNNLCAALDNCIFYLDGQGVGVESGALAVLSSVIVF